MDVEVMDADVVVTVGMFVVVVGGVVVVAVVVKSMNCIFSYILSNYQLLTCWINTTVC